MNKRILTNLKLYFPHAYEQMIKCFEIGFNEIVVLLKDNRCLIYDDSNKTIKTFPSNFDNLTDEKYAEMFSNRLRKIMEVRCISQKEISDKTGITQSSLSLYMNGKRIPNLYTVYKLSVALNCSMNDFNFFPK